jgi:hypothetical protein
VAHVENTVMDVYYRNDSMKSVEELLGKTCSWLMNLDCCCCWIEQNR